MNGVGKHEVKVLAVSCYMHFAGSMLDTDCPVGPGAEDENNWIVSRCGEGTAMQKLRCLRRHMFVSAKFLAVKLRTLHAWFRDTGANSIESRKRRFICAFPEAHDVQHQLCLKRKAHSRGLI